MKKEGNLQNLKNHKAVAYAAAVLILAFFLLVTIGSYIKIKKGVIISFSLFALVLFFLDYKRIGAAFFKSKLTYLWLGFMLVGVLSTVFIEKSSDLYILFTQVSFSAILFVLCAYTESDVFFRLYRIYVLIFALAGIYELVTGTSLFAFLKAGTQFSAIDTQVHGVLSIFEYRHYFGCYLLLAFFSVFYFPERSRLLNLFYGLIFFIVIILTFTRSVWIAFIIGLVLTLIIWIKTRKNSDVRRNQLSKKQRKSFWISLAVFLLALIILGVVFHSKIQDAAMKVLQRILDINPSNGSWFNRYFTLIHGPQYMFRHPELLPIGGGAGSALQWLATAEGAKFRGAIDCQYVHTFMETGIIGLTLFLAMLVYAVIRFFKTDEQWERALTLQYIMMGAASFFFEIVVVSSSVYALWNFVLVGIIWQDPGKGKTKLKS